MDTKESCANCQCCSVRGIYCELWMLPTRLEYWYKQWTKIKINENRRSTH